MEKLNLAERANKFWNEADKKDGEGLSLLNALLEHVRVKRDWDALAVFLGRSTNTAGAEADIKRIIKAAFGDRLTFDAARAKKHPTGVAFKMAWAEGDVVQFGNAYGDVKAAIEQGKGFRDATLQKKLKAIFAPPKVDKDFEQLVEMIAKNALAKAKAVDKDVHQLMKAAEAKIDTILKEAAQKEAAKVIA